jgi:predicted esterase
MSERMRYAVFIFAGLLAAQTVPPGPEWYALKGHDVGRIDGAEVSFLASRAYLASPKPAEDKLLRAAIAKATAGDANAAFRLLARWFAWQRGLKMGEWLDVATALDFSLDRRLGAPGDMLHARLQPLYLLDEPLQGAYTVRVALLDARGQTVSEARPLRLETLAAEELRLPTGKAPAGDYTVRYQLQDGEGKALASAARPLRLDAAEHDAAAGLRARQERLAQAGVARRGAREALALEGIEVLAELYGRALTEYVGNLAERFHPVTLSLPDPPLPSIYWGAALRPQEDLALAARLDEALSAGRDPFAGLTGEMHLGVRSGTGYRPYWLTIPPMPEAGKKQNLLVLFHGETGDESALFNAAGRLSELAGQHATLVLAPGMDGADAPTLRKEVLALSERIRAAFGVDEKRVFLGGHSGGARLALDLLLESKASWAGYINLAGPPPRLPNAGTTGEAVILFAAGGADRQLGLPVARRFGLQMRKLFPRFEYLEVAGADHEGVPAAAWPRVFAFIDEVAGGTWKASEREIPLPDARP